MATKADRLVELVSQLASEISGFFEIAGPGLGDRRTRKFMDELCRRAKIEFGGDHAEARICGTAGLRPDFYFPDEKTIVEVALSLRNPNSEFERDLLKAIMAQEAGNPVRRLLFLCKPGGEKTHAAPASREFTRWMAEKHDLLVEIHDIRPLENMPARLAMPNTTGGR